MSKRWIGGRMVELPDRNTEAVLERLHRQPDPQPVPPSTPLPGGLIFVPLTAAQLRMISEALGSHAGQLVERGGPANWEPFALTQGYVDTFIPQPREEGSQQ
jgi:hypothetical protein